LVDIIITSDEPLNPYFVASFIGAGLIPLVKKLNAGDFHIFGDREDNSILIERKEASDFLASLEDGRLWDQMAKMKDSGIEDRRVLIEGNPLKARAQQFRQKVVTPNRIYGAYEGIFNWGAKIVWTEDTYQTSAYLKNLCKRFKRPKKEFSLRTSASRKLSPQEKKRYILEGFPGIGPKASKLLVSHYDSLMEIFNDASNIDKLPGIGKTTKKEMEDILG